MSTTSGPDETGSPAARRSGLVASGVAEFRRIALALGFGAIVLGLLAFLIIIYAPVLRAILWAAALAALFFPMHQRVLRLVGGRERTAAALSTFFTILIFAAPAALLLINFASQVQNLWPSIREYLGGETFQRVAAWLEGSRLKPIVVQLLPDIVEPGAAGIEEALRQAVSGFCDLALGQLQEIGRSAPARFLGGVVTALIYFFFLRHGPGWLEQVKRALPLEPEHASNLLQIAGDTINAVFRGVVITAAVQAVLAGIGFAVAGAPVPVVLGAVTLVSALIPFVGPVAVWLPVGIGLIVTGRTAAGVGLLIWGTLVVSLVDNVLKPWLIGRQTRLPILWLFLALLGGLKVFGFLGILLGPAALSLFLACYRIYTEGRKDLASSTAP
ncbi:MAG: AI-2E family transporter [Candidatus Eiseniibacteriota bacterium]